MQTISFFLPRLQESGLGSQDLSEKPWKLKKNMLESFYIRGKRQHMFFCVNHPMIRFRLFGAEKTFESSWKKLFFPFTPDPDPHEEFCPDPDPQKKCGSETLFTARRSVRQNDLTCWKQMFQELICYRKNVIFVLPYVSLVQECLQIHRVPRSKDPYFFLYSFLQVFREYPINQQCVTPRLNQKHLHM